MISRFTLSVAWQLYFFMPELCTHIAVKRRTVGLGSPLMPALQHAYNEPKPTPLVPYTTSPTPLRSRSSTPQQHLLGPVHQPLANTSSVQITNPQHQVVNTCNQPLKTRERGSNPPEVEDAKMEPTPPKADARIGRLPPPPSTVHPLRPTPVVPTTTNPRGKRKSTSASRHFQVNFDLKVCTSQ